MNITAHIAKHMRELHFGGNWTGSSLKEQLHDVSWQQAVTQVHSFNTIAVLVFHVNYYVDAALKVLQGEPLQAHDKYSFNLPAVQSQQDWEKLLHKLWNDAEQMAILIEQVPDHKLNDFFTDEKYGTYYRNFHGIIEHTHYHLGQIALIKKLVQSPAQ